MRLPISLLHGSFSSCNVSFGFCWLTPNTTLNCEAPAERFAYHSRYTLRSAKPSLSFAAGSAGRRYNRRRAGYSAAIMAAQMAPVLEKVDPNRVEESGCD